MERTKVMADEETLAQLQRLAADRGVSFAAVVYEALEQKVRELRPTPLSLGTGQSAAGRTAAASGSKRQPPRSGR